MADEGVGEGKEIFINYGQNYFQGMKCLCDQDGCFEKKNEFFTTISHLRPHVGHGGGKVVGNFQVFVAACVQARRGISAHLCTRLSRCL